VYLDQYTGRGVRIAVIDSGVHAAHPHVNGVFDGFSIERDGSIGTDYVDRLGHGTAVAAAIREKAPDAELIAVRVFDRTLATDVSTLVRAMDEALAHGAALVNLSLGTADPIHTPAMEAILARAASRRCLVVAAVEDRGVRWLPGSLVQAIGVQLDWNCPREAYRIVRTRDERTVVASGYPRDIPNISRERNVKGISFAVANASGFVARALEASPGSGREEILDTLQSASCREAL